MAVRTALGWSCAVVTEIVLIQMFGLSEGEENIMNQNDSDKTAPPIVKKKPKPPQLLQLLQKKIEVTAFYLFSVLK